MRTWRKQHNHAHCNYIKLLHPDMLITKMERKPKATPPNKPPLHTWRLSLCYVSWLAFTTCTATYERRRTAVITSLKVEHFISLSTARDKVCKQCPRLPTKMHDDHSQSQAQFPTNRPEVFDSPPASALPSFSLLACNTQQQWGQWKHHGSLHPPLFLLPAFNSTVTLNTCT